LAVSLAASDLDVDKPLHRNLRCTQPRNTNDAALLHAHHATQNDVALLRRVHAFGVQVVATQHKLIARIL
jgi:hypothetical protein